MLIDSDLRCLGSWVRRFFDNRDDIGAVLEGRGDFIHRLRKRLAKVHTCWKAGVSAKTTACYGYWQLVAEE
jgi:hypothetical protein